MQLSVQQALLNAEKHTQNGQTSAARQLYLSILENFPDNKPAQLGLAALDKLKPQDAAPSQDQINAVIALFFESRFKEVVERATSLVKQYPQTVLLHNILAATYANLNQFDASIECSNHALQIDPENIKALKNLGGALKHIGDLTSAIECYHNALQIEPGNADLHNNLGTALKETEDIGAAEKSFQTALEIDPDNVANITSLCDFYDKTNDISGLACTISKSKNNSTLSNSNFLYYCAMLHFRQKEYAIAKTYIDQIKPDELIPKGANVFYGLKGKILDKIGMYDDAFSAFSHMNKQVADSDLCKQINPDKYFNSISSSLNKLKEAPNYLHSTNSTKIDLVNTPYFFIGFPRSGTTLLDTILRSHSKITVVEEQPMVTCVKNAMGGGNQSLQILNSLPVKRRFFCNPFILRN